MIVDTALEHLGSRNVYIYGWYFVINLLKSTSSCFHLLGFLWAHAKPTSFHCKIPDGYILNQSIPYEHKNGKQTLSQCRQYLNFSSSQNKTVPCQQGYVYEGYMKSSIVYEWNLVCDRAYLGALADSSFYILSIFFSSVFTALADRFGRRVVFLSCLLGMSLTGFLITFSPNLYVYVVLRMIMGPLQQGTYTIGYCYSMELFPMKRRTVPVLLSEIFWVTSTIILCLIAYLVRYWKLYYYVTTLPFLGSFILFFLMPESVPWLVARGRMDEAKKVLLTAARFCKDNHQVFDELNLATLTNNNLEESQSNQDTNSTSIYPCYFVCLKKHLRVWTLINMIIWLVIGLSYYAFQYYGVSFGNIYLNFFLQSIIEMPGVIFTSLVSRKIGRRIVTWIALWMVATMVLLLYLGMTFLSSLTALNVITLIVGKFFATVVFTIIFLHVGEMFPTSLRSMGMAAGTSSARLGAALTPFVIMLANLVPWLSAVIIVVSCFVAGCLSLHLPETKRWPLPQTLGEVYAWRKDPKYQSNWCNCKQRPEVEP